MGPQDGTNIYNKKSMYNEKFKSYSWVGLLGQPSGLADGSGRPDGAGRPGDMGLGQPILGRPHVKCTAL